jgi:hypothetical protein
MSKQIQPNFSTQWLLVQVGGSIALAIVTQAIVTLIILLLQIDNLFGIYAMRLLGYVVSNAIQGYFQWQMLKQVIKTLDRAWIYTSIGGLPINILTWSLIQLGIETLVVDEDGTVLIVLAIVGAVGGGINGLMIGNWQKSLFRKSLYWRSLWHDWDREQLLAGALSGIVTSVMTICSVLLFGKNWIALPLSGFICSIGLASISQVMYGLIVGDTIHDIFRQAKLLE